jgi:pyruvate kinase
MNNKTLKTMLHELSSIEKQMKLNADLLYHTKQRFTKNHHLSAQNLIHYLTLRNIDIRLLQNELHNLGLSSLSSSESHILRQVQEIKKRLGSEIKPGELSNLSATRASAILHENKSRLFGNEDPGQLPFIMVTFDKSFANDYSFIKSLLLNGMSIARINCAHDDEVVWSAMIHQLKKACKKTGKSCKIYMDLAGPKIRTQILSKKKHDKRTIVPGQLIWLTENKKEADDDHLTISPGVEGLLVQLKKGERVLIDDGLIQCEIESTHENKVGMRVVRVSKNKMKLKENKGINFPDSELNIAALTEFDERCLPYIIQNADMVGYSFVKRSADLDLLNAKMNQPGSKKPYLIIKIETPQAVKNLPQLLLAGMQEQCFGVMIARGDLAVEIGFERTGEIQEEILWLCEAAHVPVIWATQVLESLNKSGLATRSEITDAVHASAADCIMLNKGPHTIETLETLKEILKKSTEHKNKKRYLLRPLNIAGDYIRNLNAL